MKKIFFKILLLFIIPLLISCHKDKDGEYLSKSKFEDVLYDVHIYEAFLGDDSYLPSSWAGSYDRKQDYKDLNYLNIFKKYNITDTIFFNSVAHYSKNLSSYYDIYFDLDNRINAELKRLKAQVVLDNELRIKIKNLGKRDANYYLKLKMPNLDSINSYSINCSDSLRLDSMQIDSMFVKSIHYYFPSSLKSSSYIFRDLD